VVISPPGGVGEVAAVKAACLGTAVRWFVISGGSQKNNLALSQEALDSIDNAGGTIQLAGADAESLLISENDDSGQMSALSAVSQWCGRADALLCAFDGIQQKKKNAVDEGKEDPAEIWENAIKVAAKEAAQSVSGLRLAILPALDNKNQQQETEDDASSGGLGDLMGKLPGNIFGGNKVSVPSTLESAMMESGNSGAAQLATLRHGQLFGIPESSPDFSPLLGGPRRTPELCEEYSERMVRVDPSVSVSGNLMMGSNTRSSRHAVGEAAALMALQKVAITPGLDVCVSSQRGSDVFPEELWKKEFERVEQMSAPSTGGGAVLFSADFASVPDKERLADWLATKWAPAVLRTYDIAAIRIGARPVYANKVSDNEVEIMWQQLVNFESVVTGRMIIEVTDTGLRATRGPGGANTEFSSTSRQPLNGEDVLVRRLAEAASQAMEKGLATKPAAPKVTKKEKVAPVQVSSIQSSGTVPEEAAPAPSSSASGPRKAGAKRSKERARRGSSKRRKKAARTATAATPPEPTSTENKGDFQ